MRRKIAVLLTLGLLTSNITGCELVDKFMKTKKVETVADVVAASNEAMQNVESFALDGKIDVDMSIASEGLSLDIPIKLDFEMNVGGENYVYMDMGITASALGQSFDDSMKMYLEGKGDDVVTYMKSAKEDDWTYTTEELGFEKFSDITGKKGVLIEIEGSEFSEADNYYVVTASANDILKDMGVKDIVDDYSEIFTGTSFESGEMVDNGLEEARAVYYFDKETFHLAKFELKDISVEQESEQGTLRLDLEVDYAMRDFNALEEEDYKVSDSIKNSAKEQVEEDDNGLGGIEIPNEPVTEEPLIEEPMMEEPIVEEESVEEIPVVQNSVNNDELLSMSFTLDGMSFTLPCKLSDFEEFGYGYDYEGTDYDGLGYTLNNGDYISGCDADVPEEYQPSFDEYAFSLYYTIKNLDREAKDALECYVSEISMSVEDDADAYPSLVLPGGITFGSTIAEVEATYGTGNPDEIYISEDSDYRSYSYGDLDTGKVEIVMVDGVVCDINIDTTFAD